MKKPTHRPSPALKAIGITGLGKYLPRRKCTNKELAKRLKVSPEWIVHLTGVKTRHFMNGNESAFSMSAEAAREALARANIKASGLDLVIACRSSGDYLFPPLACKVQDILGASHAGAFDLSASSVGFTVGMSVAGDRLRSDPSLKHAVVIACATQSPFLDWKEPKTSALLGDGCAAAVLSHVPTGYGLLGFDLLSRGHVFDAAYLKSCGHIRMDGVTMGRAFLKYQPLLIQKVLRKAGLTVKDVDLYIFHQANARLIQFLMDRMKLPMSKTYTNAERLGNTADASILLALCEAWEAGRIRRGDVIVLSGVGAGCLAGVLVMRWY